MPSKKAVMASAICSGLPDLKAAARVVSCCFLTCANRSLLVIFICLFLRLLNHCCKNVVQAAGFTCFRGLRLRRFLGTRYGGNRRRHGRGQGGNVPALEGCACALILFGGCGQVCVLFRIFVGARPYWMHISADNQVSPSVSSSSFSAGSLSPALTI